MSSAAVAASTDRLPHRTTSRFAVVVVGGARLRRSPRSFSLLRLSPSSLSLSFARPPPPRSADTRHRSTAVLAPVHVQTRTHAVVRHCIPPSELSFRRSVFPCRPTLCLFFPISVRPFFILGPCPSLFSPSLPPSSFSLSLLITIYSTLCSALLCSHLFSTASVSPSGAVSVANGARVVGPAGGGSHCERAAEGTARGRAVSDVRVAPRGTSSRAARSSRATSPSALHRSSGPPPGYHPEPA